MDTLRRTDTVATTLLRMDMATTTDTAATTVRVCASMVRERSVGVLEWASAEWDGVAAAAGSAGRDGLAALDWHRSDELVAALVSVPRGRCV